MQRIEAFLIDSNKLFREGLKRLLDDSPFQIVAEAGNIREGVAIAESGLRPQLAAGIAAGQQDGRVDD
jgi:two-component system nitrate/nitrite response regulator NarL